MGKKELIVTSTKKLIIEKGYKNICVEDITNDAGIAKGSFYTYFKSKNLVIDYILEEKIREIKANLKLNYDLGLEQNIRKLVKERIELKDNELKENLVLINLFRNVASLDEKTVALLREIHSLMIGAFISLMESYEKEIKIKKEEIKYYAKIVNSIISNYKTFTLFISEKDNQFVNNISEVKEKYKTQDFKRNIEIISESILKILIY